MSQSILAIKRSAGLKDNTNDEDQQINEIRAKNYQNVLETKKYKQEEIIHLLDKDELIRQSRTIDNGGEIASQMGQLRPCLEEKKQVKVCLEMKQNNQLLKRELQQSSQVKLRSCTHHLHLPHRGQVSRIQGQEFNLMNWRDGGKAQLKMCNGAAVVKGKVAYFMHWNGRTCSYNSTNKKWSELPKYPYQYASLVLVSGQVTAIGGCSDICNDNSYTNKLLSLRQGWTEVFPPMTTKRRDTIATATEKHLIVAGGMCGPFINACVNTVEVMDNKSLVWSTVASLPHPYTGASVAICGGHLFMLGGFDKKSETKSALSCSLTELLQSSLSSSSSSVWQRVADAPAYQSTCAAVDGELVVVGGTDKEDKATAIVHKYNPTTDCWDFIGKMPTARYNCHIAVLPTNEVMVAGGEIQWNKTTDRVEMANFNFY